MSSGSVLNILRSNKKHKHTVRNKIINNKIEEFKSNLAGLVSAENITVPNYLMFEDNMDIMLSIKDKQYFNILLDAHFSSQFTELTDEYNLNPYNGTNQVVIDIHTAKEMLQAIKYLLSRNYSLGIEDILDNYWISVFSELLPSYSSQNITNTEIINENNEFEQEGKYILTKFKTVLETYILLVNENCCNEYQYILLYSAY